MGELPVDHEWQVGNAVITDQRQRKAGRSRRKELGVLDLSEGPASL